MDIDTPNTKTALVLAAGELFAEHGFDRVSTRMIADKAGVNLGGIHYHFGSKEDLYVAAFKYACQHDERPGFAQILSDNPELAKTPEGQAQAILQTCRLFLEDMVEPHEPVWRTHLIIREISTPSSAFPILVREVFQTDFTKDMQAYLRLRPNATEDDALVWHGFLKAQAMFYLLARLPLETVRNGKPLDRDFADALIRGTAAAMILMMGLPLPEELKTSGSMQKQDA